MSGQVRAVHDHFGQVDGLDTQLVHDADAGWMIRIGQIYLDAGDVDTMRKAIAAFDSAVGSR